MDTDTIRVTGAGGAQAVESEAPAVDSAEPDGSGGREGCPVGVGGRGAWGSGLGGGAASWGKVVSRGGGRGISRVVEAKPRSRNGLSSPGCQSILL